MLTKADNLNLEFVGRADSQVVTNVVCNRFHPDPLGIVLWRYKLEFGGQLRYTGG